MQPIARVRALLLLLCLVLMSSLAPPAAARPSPDPRTAVLSQTSPPTPTYLAESFALAANRIIWHEGFTCDPALPSAARQIDVEAKTYLFFRMRSQGGDTRPIYSRTRLGRCPDSLMRSPIVADARFVYWLTTEGLVRISVDANPGDLPDLLNSNLADDQDGLLALTDDYIYGSRGALLFRIPKAGPFGGETLSVAGSAYQQLQATDDALYYVLDRTLYRRAADTGIAVSLAADVDAYYAEGFRRPCLSCLRTNYVYIAQGNQVRIYNHVTQSFSVRVYTSPNPTAKVTQVAGSAANIFVFERQCRAAGEFCDAPAHLVRTSRALDAPETIYVTDNNVFPRQLTTDDLFIHWIDGGPSSRLRSLLLNAAVLPVINLYPTGMEITQGIQTATNSVVLIQNKRTFVRVFARASSANPVFDVPMNLEVRGANGSFSRLAPINDDTKELTVRSAPDPLDVSHAFLFEVPISQTNERWLRFTAIINPYRFPLEPNYDDNVLESEPFFFEQSPRVLLQFVSFAYTLGGVTYRPRIVEDMEYNADYIRRTYPLASSVGGFGDPRPGLRTAWFGVHDAGLGARILVTQPNQLPTIAAPECSKAPFYYVRLKPDSLFELELVDNRSLCASAYVNSQMVRLRRERQLADQVLMYGMISAGGGSLRGQASVDNGVASGPASDGAKGYYAAHEVGHLLGRDHPSVGSGPAPQRCGHDSIDVNYPYASSNPLRAPIGPLDGSVRGFTPVVDPRPGSQEPPFRVIGPEANDYMSYCGNYWISDYTYRGIYNTLKRIVPLSQPALVPAQAGPWLSVSGVLNPAGAAIHDLRLLEAAGPTAAAPAARFAVRLLAADGRTLAEHGLPPGELADAEELQSFAAVVPADAQARTVEIVDRQEARVLAASPVSASAPSVGALELSGPSELRWTASDPDGDRLRFDLFWSRDGGMSFVPVLLGLETTSATIDTAALGGGEGVFRVVAHDGAHTAAALSPPVTLEAKPPSVWITSPLDGAQVEWNQLVTFQASAFDLQDGPLAEASLVWTDADGVQLGTGELLAADRLPVGTNRIRLTATNSLGLSASAAVTVQVDDRLDPLGPTLSVMPSVTELVATGEAPAPQTLEVRVSNAGGGTLSWEASSDQPWLTLDSASGAGEATVTLTVTPADIPLGESATAIITWRTTGSGEAHSVQTRVHVDRFNPILGVDPPPGAPAGSRVYLPLLRR